MRDSLAQGADPNTLHSKCYPAVFGAAEHGQLAVCGVLIGTRRLNLEARCPKGGTALFAASQFPADIKGRVGARSWIVQFRSI